jgi:hypothetical protein
MPSDHPILTHTFSLGLTVKKEVMGILAHSVTASSTYPQNEYGNHMLLWNVGHCTWYRMEHSIVTVSFKGFYQAKEHGS